MNPIGATVVALLSTMTVCGGRRTAGLSLLAGVLFLTNAQALDVNGVHLFPMRILEVSAIVRIFLRGEVVAVSFNTIDRLVFALYAYTLVVFVCRSDVEHSYVLGVAVDAIFCYFSFRALVRKAEDLVWILNAFVILLIPYVSLLVVEATTESNPFQIIGGTTFVERGERLRCMGSFRHPSLLGTLGASFLPLYLALVRNGLGRLRAGVGVSLCISIIVLANSGGPVTAAGVGVLGWMMWPLRQRMALVRRTLVALLLVLAVGMNAPLWYLPAKVSALSGGDGWHRSYLMEVAFRELDTWWLAGVDIATTRNWFHYTLAATGSADITNQYLLFGLTAGLPAIGIFVLLLVKTFSAVGQALSALRMQSLPDNRFEALLWALGCSAAVHVATWLGITYNFDQTYVIWLVQLAAISSLTADAACAPLPASTRLPARLVTLGRR